MHAMNNTMIVDHHDLVIHLDLGYLGSMHDSTILKYSEIDHKYWWQYFFHDPPYMEFLLGDPRYIGNEEYIIRCIGKVEIAPNVDLPTIHAYNKLHARYRFHNERGIGRVK